MTNRTSISPSLFLEIVDAINKAMTFETLFKSTMELMPIDRASYHHFPSVGAFDYKTLGTYHGYNLPEFVENYYRNYDMKRSDPSLVAVFKKGGFIWLSDLFDEPLVIEAQLSEDFKAFFDYVGEGLSIPLFGPNCRRGYMYVSGDEFTKEPGSIFAYQIQALASLFHARFSLMIHQIERQINLTQREAEVLELLTYGKTNREIAEILEISISTVAGYMKALFLKLDVTDRVSASMRAQSLKVIF